MLDTRGFERVRLAVVASLFQHGGRPLDWLSEYDYRSKLSASDIRRVFVSGATHRPGFLMNSWELTSLAHVPPPDISVHVQTDTNALETLPPPEQLMVGVPIGYCDCAGVRQPVCIPPDARLPGVRVGLIRR